jgi:hypothetical protein
VGTQIRIASGSTSREKSAVASNRIPPARRRDLGVADVLERALASVEPVDLRHVDVEPEHAEAGARGGQHQGQADVAHADDADHGLPLREAPRQLGRARGRRGHGRLPYSAT